MYRFTSNPPCRQVAPRPALLPSEAHAQRTDNDGSLHAIVEAHLARTGLAPSTLSRQITGDSRLVAAIRRGRQPKPALAARIVAVCAGEARHGC